MTLINKINPGDEVVILNHGRTTRCTVSEIVGDQVVRVDADNSYYSGTISFIEPEDRYTYWMIPEAYDRPERLFLSERDVEKYKSEMLGFAIWTELMGKASDTQFSKFYSKFNTMMDLVTTKQLIDSK